MWRKTMNHKRKKRCHF